MEEFNDLYAACINVNADHRGTVESFEYERVDLLEKLKAKLKNHGDISDVIERDYFAGQAMKAEIITWNTEMTDKHRGKLLEDMVNRNGGELTINEQLAKNSFDMADAMMNAR